eukprot:TRINITY_DN4915_c0_g1_i1.p1 TRINITY_DN4915_c0_g1~~TRINITY_DN4915_c0_g1_i1.p1  ORF type:complete len:133 (+),score=25.73 TRINITY_DN4915_c0_g1_i1:319-717(+)
MHAKENGSTLFEEADVSECTFLKSEGIWIVKTKDERVFQRRMLVVVDGSNSYIGKKLGISEGQPTAMLCGKFAAETIDKMFEQGDFSSESCSVYHTRWMDDFGNDFYWSMMMAKVMFHFPIPIDALSVVGER